MSADAGRKAVEVATLYCFDPRHGRPNPPLVTIALTLAPDLLLLSNRECAAAPCDVGWLQVPQALRCSSTAVEAVEYRASARGEPNFSAPTQEG